MYRSDTAFIPSSPEFYVDANSVNEWSIIKLCNTVRRQSTRWLAMYETFNSAGVIRVPSSEPEIVINKLENKRTSTASGIVGFITNMVSDGWSKSRRCRIFNDRLQCSEVVRTLDFRAIEGIRGCQVVVFGGNGK